MARRLVPDEVWRLVQPMLPKRPRSAKGGRPAVSNRGALTGMLFVLKTGIAWEDLPLEMGCGSGMTCLRRLREWQASGVWDRIQPILQQHICYAERIDWSRVDSQAARPLVRRRHAAGSRDLARDESGVSVATARPAAVR